MQYHAIICGSFVVADILSLTTVIVDEKTGILCFTSLFALISYFAVHRMAVLL
jgi:hypothetical protein